MAALNGSDLLAASENGWKKHGRSGRFPRQIDIVFGGPPCQGFSTIGKRLIDDDRNKLVFHFFRLVTELRPRYFVMENVPGMAAGGHQTILAQLVREFSAAGYTLAQPVSVLEAPHFGVPQARRRLFLLGSREGESPLSYPRPRYRPAEGSRAKRRKTTAGMEELPVGPTVWEALGDLPNADWFEGLMDDDAVRLSEEELARLEAIASPYARRLRGLGKDEEDLSYPRVWDRHLLTSSMRTTHTALSVERYSETLPGETEPVSRFLRLPEDGLCNTLRAGTGSERGAYTSPRPIHPKLPRVITVREAARLHSFPDWFRLHRTKWHGFRQVGNAVPPLLARAVAGQIVSAMGVRPVKPGRELELADPSLLEMSMERAAEYLGAVAAQMPKKRRRLAAAR